MNIREYQNLVLYCEALLAKVVNKPECLAFSSLHIRNPHPSQTARFFPETKATLKNNCRKKILRIIQRLASTIWPRKIANLWEKNGLLKIDHVIISHEIGFSSEQEDFYFGRIPENLGIAGQKVLILRINHLRWRCWYHDFILTPCGNNIQTVTLPGWSTWTLEEKISSLSRRGFDYLCKEIGPSEHGQKIMGALRQEANGDSPTFSLRIFFWVRELLKKIQPSSVFFTWEGHAWERLVIRAAREVSPRTFCIGFQHTVLLPHARGPFRSMGRSADPDSIWTVGKPNYRKLKQTWDKKRIVINIYGSPRSCKLSLLKWREKNPLCVVAPEGIEEEAMRLFIFGKRLALLAPTIEFSFRSHPLMPIKYIIQKTPALRDLPENVKIGGHTGTADLREARWFIYRGTSLVFEALQCGTRPIYVAENDEICIDPLYKLKKWKRSVTDPLVAYKIMVRDLKKYSKNMPSVCLRAKIWATNYFMPQNDQLVRNFSKKRLFL